MKKLAEFDGCGICSYKQGSESQMVGNRISKVLIRLDFLLLCFLDIFEVRSGFARSARTHILAVEHRRPLNCPECATACFC